MLILVTALIIFLLVAGIRGLINLLTGKEKNSEVAIRSAISETYADVKDNVNDLTQAVNAASGNPNGSNATTISGSPNGGNATAASDSLAGSNDDASTNPKDGTSGNAEDSSQAHELSGNAEDSSQAHGLSGNAEETSKPHKSSSPSLRAKFGARDEKTLVKDTAVWKGYEITDRSNAYYISSENFQSTYGILIDATDGSVVCQKDGFTRMYPASMTKVLTVLVAAESLTEADLDEKVTITVEETDYVFKHDLSAVGFAVGEEVTVRDLFYGTILESGADAAMALVNYVCEDEDAFVRKMNDKVADLGLSATTHFSNPVGLFSEDNYTTCADMAMILKAAIENKFCYEVLNAHKYTTSITPEHPEGILCSNWFLRRIEDKDTKGEVLCAKTGFVNKAGSCAASYELTDSNHPYICVSGQAHSSWRCIYDHVDLYYNNTK